MRGSKYAVIHKTYLVICWHDCCDSGDFDIINNQYFKIKGLSINNLEKMLSFWYAFLQWRQAYEREIMGSV